MLGGPRSNAVGMSAADCSGYGGSARILRRWTNPDGCHLEGCGRDCKAGAYRLLLSQTHLIFYLLGIW